MQQSQQYDHQVLPLGQAEHAGKRLDKLAQRRVLDYNGLGQVFFLLSRLCNLTLVGGTLAPQFYRFVKSAKLLVIAYRPA